MGLRDQEYMLGDEVELDEGSFKTVSLDRDKEKPLKRGRRSQQQSKVLVSVESKDAKESHNPKKHSLMLLKLMQMELNHLLKILLRE